MITLHRYFVLESLGCALFMVREKLSCNWYCDDSDVAIVERPIHHLT